MNNLFAVDSSGKTAGVCIMQDGAVVYEQTLNQGLTHSETLLPLAQQAFAATGLHPGDINVWGLAAGPGSFTGLRIGMALVKGLAFPGTGLVAGVSTLEALAVGSGLRGTVISALDARRGEVYWAAFVCGKKTHRLTPDAAGKVDCMAEIVRKNVSPIYFVGDGAELCYNSYNCEAAVKQPAPSGPVSIARGVALLTLQAQNQGETVPAKYVHPNYLRLSQAERERALRMAQL